jgi:hypothetical protein
VANNKQVAAAASVSTNSNLGITDAMHQTTLMECFNPPHPLAPTMLPDGYWTIMIDGTKYLLNDMTNHLMIVSTVTASVTAQSITPIDLSKKSFVMPSVKKSSKRKKFSSSSIVLAKHKEYSSGSCSGDSSIVYVHAKKKKKKRKTRTNKNKTKKTTKLLGLVSSQNLSSGDEDEVIVVENPAATLEVETEVETQVLPQTEDFGQAKVVQEDEVFEDDNISDLPPNLLEDNDDK